MKLRRVCTFFVRWKPSMFVLGFLVCVMVCPVQAADGPVDSVQVNVPRRAMLRSLVLPGWGQFYNGKKVKGSVIALAEVGSVVAYFVRRDQLKSAGSSERNVYFFSTIGIVLYSMADAYVDAYLGRVDWAEVEAGIDAEGAAKLRVKFHLGR